MKRRVIFTLGMVTALVGLVLLSPFASSLPDGLEKVAADLGFGRDDGGAFWQAAPAPDYLAAGIDDRPLATRLAGLAGTALAFVLTAGLARALLIRTRRGRRHGRSDARCDDRRDGRRDGRCPERVDESGVS